jgi:hypothetical protein
MTITKGNTLEKRNNHHQEYQIKRKSDRHFIGNTLEKRRQPSLKGNDHH